MTDSEGDPATPPPTTAIRLRHDGAIGRITLARPEKLNALSRAALEELAEGAAWFDELPTVKVVVVNGEGDSFSAGFDLADPSWSELGPPELSRRQAARRSGGTGGARRGRWCGH